MSTTTVRTTSDDDRQEVQRQTYTVTEMAKILGIGRNTAYEACRNGEIPTIRIGGRVLIPCTAVNELLNGVG